MNLGYKLKTFRVSQGLSLKEVSLKTNLSISFLSDIENNRSSPSISNLKLLSKKLNIPISYLLDDNDNDSEIIQEEILLSDIIKSLEGFSSWSEDDKLELFYYLKAKDSIRKFDKKS